MLAMGSPTSVRTSTSCNALLRELQQIWNDIGESEVDKDRMLLELERECLQVYRRKVDEAVNAKARLHQSVAAKEAELATLMAALGELKGHSPIGQACRPAVKGLGMWGLVKALGRGYEYIMGVVIFVPIAVLAWFPFVTLFQTRLLFNQAFSQGLQIQRILAGGKKQKQKQK